MKRLGGVAALLGLATALIGAWLFSAEQTPATDQGNALAAGLLWVGSAIALVGIAAWVIGLATEYDEDEFL